jgi:AraC family transcriptional regulator, transcriptional activator of pobA
MADAASLVRHRAGVPTYRYPTGIDIPPVLLVRARDDDVLERGRHIHTFPALWYAPEAALVYVAAAGVVLHPEKVVRTHDGVGVFFDPAAVGGDTLPPWTAWRAHPLLFPFLHGRSGGLLRLRLPAGSRPAWDGSIGSIEDELAARRDGYQQAALAHLTLLLIEVARLAGDVVDDLRQSGEPLLADVFAVIERRHSEALSLRDVARELAMTPGHLTTIVRRRTGRTVQEWITERRMSEARDLLSETELPISEVARLVGMPDPGYFSRVFRRMHGTSPRHWRGRPV